MRRDRIGLVAIVLGLAIILAAGVAAAEDSPACRFTGTATAGGSDVAGGTLVTAVIDGDRYHTHTPLGGSSYALTIRAPEGRSYPNGTQVVFEVDGYQASETATFQAGGTVRLDLTTPVAGAGHSSAAAVRAQSYSGQAEESMSTGTVIGLCVGILVAGGLAYYGVLLRRVFARRAVNTGGKSGA